MEASLKLIVICSRLKKMDIGNLLTNSVSTLNADLELFLQLVLPDLQMIVARMENMLIECSVTLT